jgi:hypothetical protein
LCCDLVIIPHKSFEIGILQPDVLDITTTFERVIHRPWYILGPENSESISYAELPSVLVPFVPALVGLLSVAVDVHVDVDVDVAAAVVLGSRSTKGPSKSGFRDGLDDCMGFAGVYGLVV